MSAAMHGGRIGARCECGGAPGRKSARRGCAGEGTGRMRVHEDSDAVFEAAIRNGVLSADPASARYAGHYMYLFHDADGTAWFKHIDSRVSVTMSPQAKVSEPHA